MIRVDRKKTLIPLTGGHYSWKAHSMRRGNTIMASTDVVLKWVSRQ